MAVALGHSIRKAPALHFWPKRSLTRDGLIAAVVVAVHALLLIQMTKLLRPPTTLGDGSSDQIAMIIALSPASVLLEPRSQGADFKTETFALTTAADPQLTPSKEAQGGGEKPLIDAGGAHDDAQGETAPAARGGGGGGSKDDPWARASLPAPEGPAGVFDLAAKNEALFRNLVRPCLGDNTEALENVAVAVTLAQDGTVVSAIPVRRATLAATAITPTAYESQAIAAIRACAPYHEMTLGTSPVLRAAPSVGMANSMRAAGSPSTQRSSEAASGSGR